MSIQIQLTPWIQDLARLGLPILDGDDLASAQEQFDEMVAERTDALPHLKSSFPSHNAEHEHVASGAA